MILLSQGYRNTGFRVESGVSNERAGVNEVLISWLFCAMFLYENSVLSEMEQYRDILGLCPVLGLVHTVSHGISIVKESWLWRKKYTIPGKRMLYSPG